MISNEWLSLSTTKYHGVSFFDILACLALLLLNNQCCLSQHVDHSVTTEDDSLTSAWSLDLDIDSDNNNGQELPDCSNWEDEIESHDYSIGKLIETQANQFTPVLVRLCPTLIRSQDLKIQFEFENAVGEVRLWRKAKDQIADENADLVPTGVPLALEQLSFDSRAGVVTIWLEAIKAAPGVDTKVEIDANGRPDMYLKATLLGSEIKEAVADKAKYLPVNPGSFFARFLEPANRPLRNAIAATLVNGTGKLSDAEFTVDPYQGKAFGMRIVSEPEIQNVLLKSKQNDSQSRFLKDVMYYNLATTEDPMKFGVRGMRLALYRDYNFGDYTVAFQNAYKDDIKNYFRNQTRGGLDELSIQGFELATRSGRHRRLSANLAIGFFHESYGLKLQNLQIAGCGIGGELAVFGALSSGLHADTFDTAPVSKAMIEVILQPYDPRQKKRHEAYENGSLARLSMLTELISGYEIKESPFVVLPSTFPIEK